MITLLVLALPRVNIIMYFVQAFSGTGNINRGNFCRASLLWFVIINGNLHREIEAIMLVSGPAFGSTPNM